MKALLVIAGFLFPLVVTGAREALTDFFKSVFSSLIDPLDAAIGRIRKRWSSQGPRLWPRPRNEGARDFATIGESDGEIVNEAGVIWTTSMVRLVALGASTIVYLGLFSVLIVTEYRLGAMRFASITHLPLSTAEQRQLVTGLETFGGLTLAAVPVTWALLFGEISGLVPWPSLFRPERADGSHRRWLRPAVASGLIASILLTGACWGIGQWATELVAERAQLTREQTEQKLDSADGLAVDPGTTKDLKRRDDELDDSESELRLAQVGFVFSFGVLVGGALAITGVALLPFAAIFTALGTWLMRSLLIPVIAGLWILEFGARSARLGLDLTQRTLAGSVTLVATVGDFERTAAKTVGDTLSKAWRAKGKSRGSEPGSPDG